MSKLNTKRTTTTTARASSKKPTVSPVSGNVVVETTTTNPVRSANGNINAAFTKHYMLYDLVCGTLYGETSDSERRRSDMIFAIDQLVAAGHYDFIANLAVYSRTEMKVRTMSIMLVVHFLQSLRKYKRTYIHSRKLVCDVIRRADQIHEMVAYAISIFGSKKAIPSALKRGVADAFNKFDEYQLGKYKGNGKSVSLRDALLITHPTPKNDEQSAIFSRLRDDKLAIPETWETKLSAGLEAKSVIWTNLVLTNQLGYMALVRNLRNIWEATDGMLFHERELVRGEVCAQLQNDKGIKRSGILPFSIVKSLDVVNTFTDKSNNVKELKAAISKALEISFDNIPKMGDRVVIILDVSSSMKYNHADEHAAMFTAAMVKAAHLNGSKVDIITFANSAKHISMDKNKTFAELINDIRRMMTGGGTSLNCAYDLLDQLNLQPDFVAVLSDGDVNPVTARYSGIPVTATKASFNLHNTSRGTPFSQANGWYNITGFSERVFDLFDAVRQGDHVLTKLNCPYGEWVIQ